MSDETNSKGDLQDSSVESTYSSGSNSPVASARATALPDRSTRDLIMGLVCAISVLTSLWLWSKLHDAEKDIQTQVWVRDDALTKFEQGPFADLKAHVIALEITCKR